MMPQDVYIRRVSQMADELKNGPKAKGKNRIYLPGEMEWEKREKALASGELEITDAMADSYMDLSSRNGIAIQIFEE